MISDQWQQMMVVFDGRKVNPSERLKYYVNGVGGFFKDYAAANPLTLGGVGVVTYIGRYAWAPISFKGKIDDVRIYNRALSEAEVKVLYDYERSGNQPTERAEWTLPSVAPVVGQTYRVQISLKDLTNAISGLSMKIKYPVSALRLESAQSLNAGSWVPTSALKMWHVGPTRTDYVNQNGSVLVAMTSQSDWVGTGGVIAELTFRVQEGLSGNATCLIELSEIELTGSGFDIRVLSAVTVKVTGDGGVVHLTQQPQSVVGVEGETVQLSVTATGSPTPAYQWLKNGKAVPGANLPTLSLPNFTEADAGGYSVVVSNAVNAVTSAEAVVTYQAAMQILANGKPVTGTVRTLNPLSIELSFARPGWYLFYTLDGSQPDTISNFYNDAFTITKPVTVRVIGYSPEFSKVYYSEALTILFLQPQLINWGNLGTMQIGKTATLNVTSNSGLPVDVSLVSGPASLAGNILKSEAAGQVVLRVSQAGNEQFAPVVSEKTITIEPATQVLTWPTLVDKQFGDPMFGVEVASDSGLPVTLKVLLGKASSVGTNVTLTGAGEVILAATQAGSANFKAIIEQRSFNVAKAQQTLTMPSIANRTFNPQPFMLSALASSGLPVKFTVLSGPALIEQGAVRLTGVGSVLLRADQPGNDDYEATLPVDKTFVVSKAEQTLTVPTIANRTFNPQPFTPSAVVSSGLTVKFTVLSGPAVIEQGAVKLTGVGSVLLRAEQPGNDDYEAALPVDKTFVVSKGDQTLTFDAVGGRTFGDSAVMLTAKSSSGLSVSYRVVSGPGTIAGGSLTLTGAGTVLVQAVQAGDANYNPAAANQSIVVAKAAQSIKFPVLANVGYKTNATVLNATSSSGLGVAYRVIQGAATLSGSALSLSGVGAVSVAADQTGDGNYLPAISVTNAFTVARGDQTIAFTAIGDQYLGGPPIALKGTSSVGLPVIFQLVTGPATVFNGELTLLGEGTVTVRAKQVGSPFYNATQADQTFLIRKLTLEVTVAGNQGGSVVVTPQKDLYAPTDVVTLTATATSGFAFSGWSGDLTGSANPATLVMSASRAVTASFKDVQAPAVTLNLPVAGPTEVEQARLSGEITDNVGSITAQWSQNGGVAQALNLKPNGTFAIENLVLSPGTNRFAVISRDAAGNESKIERDVIWVPLRVLQVANAASVQEGQRMVFVVKLVSPGDVAGLTFNLKYDPTYLVDPKMEWGALVGQSVNNVNIGTIGQISGGFALAGTGLPEGTNLLATISFRARSIPIPLATSLQPSIVSMSSPSGSALMTGNMVVAGEGQIVLRKIKGDNNANQRVDIGDATVISRLEIGLEEKRIWDVALNDLNGSQTLDSGDVVKALRIVVGMDVPPGPMGDAKRLSMALAMEPTPMSTHYSAELALLDGPTIQVGRPYRVAVTLKAGQGDLTGLSFSLKYPASLELKEKAIAAGVPTDALPAWNVSGNRAKLAVIRPKAWAAHSGTVAVFTFEAKPEAAKQVTLPISLEDLEVADVDEGLSAIPSVWLEIGGGLTAAPELRVRRAGGEALSLEVVGSEGLPMVLEASDDMTAWTETQRLTGQGTGTPVKVTLQPDPTVQAKFWRVRVR
jgi:hypothetical protein